MGLPKININFFNELVGRGRREAAGIVALILKDDAHGEELTEYTQDSKIEGWDETNTKYIQHALMGGPRKIIIATVPSEAESYDAAFAALSNVRFDYLAVPGVEDKDTDAIQAWVLEQRKVRKFTTKAVLPNTAANNMAIVNFTTEENFDGVDTFTASQYTARIAGILAGLPFNRSATYFVLRELKSVKVKDNPDTAVDSGELILIDDGEKIKIGRGVNSLVTIEEDDRMSDEFKSIRIVDILDMINNEIRTKFEDEYIGRVPNIYDNQVLFINDVNKGFEELAALGLLDPYSVNEVEIDVEAQRAAWYEDGYDTSDWDDQMVKEKSYKRHVFLKGHIRPVDTIEDLDLNIEL